MFRRIYNAIADALSHINWVYRTQKKKINEAIADALSWKIIIQKKKINEAMKTIPKEIEVCVNDYAFTTASIEVTREGTYLIEINTRAIMNLIHQYGFTRASMGEAIVVIVEHELGHWLTQTVGNAFNLSDEEAAWSAGSGFCGVDVDPELRMLLMKYSLDSYEDDVLAGGTASGGAVV